MWSHHTMRTAGSGAHIHNCHLAASDCNGFLQDHKICSRMSYPTTLFFTVILQCLPSRLGFYTALLRVAQCACDPRTAELLFHSPAAPSGDEQAGAPLGHHRHYEFDTSTL